MTATAIESKGSVAMVILAFLNQGTKRKIRPHPSPLPKGEGTGFLLRSP
jgi:hypothetical protein